MPHVRVLRVTAASALVASTLLLTAPSQAAIDQCNTGRMCFWHNSSYEGTFFSRTSSDGDLGSNSDEAHSLYNRTGYNWIVYDDKNYSTGDRRFCVVKGARAANLGSSTFKFGDKISSVKKLAGACPAEIPRITG
jgi:Peptidase inhibitor family I36